MLYYLIMSRPVGAAAGGRDGLTIAELLAGGGFNGNSLDLSDSDGDSVITGNGSAFSTMSIDEADQHYMVNPPDEVFHDPAVQNLEIYPVKNEVKIGPPPPYPGSNAVGRIDDDMPTEKVPKIAPSHTSMCVCNLTSRWLDLAHDVPTKAPGSASSHPRCCC